MVNVTYDFKGRKFSAKITYSNRNGRTYYWVDLLDSNVVRELGRSFTYISNDTYHLAPLTPLTKENRALIAFFRRKIIQKFLHSQLNNNEGGSFIIN